MGQVQRRQQQDIELWELYEGEKREKRKSERGGRGRNVGRDSRSAEVGRTAPGREPGRNTGRIRQSEAGRRNSPDREAYSGGDRRGRQDREAYSGGDRRARQNREAYSRSDRRVRRGEETHGRSGSNREGSSIRLYEVRRDEARPRSKTAGSARRAEGAARSRRSSRTRDISEISFIGRDPQTAYRGSARPVQSIRRRRARRRKELLSKTMIVFFMVLCLVLIYFITGQIYQMVHREKEEKQLPVTKEQTFREADSDTGIAPPEVIQDLLEINEYSRPGDKLGQINNIFVHYTANPGTSAAQNRSYFANLAMTHERSASAHLIIGYEGELIQCIPFDEQAYAVMTRNEDSISIECCYLSDDGSFTEETYDTLVHTLAWLLDKFDLSTEDILRHYDCGGKLCPLYYAENEGAWDELRQDVEAYLKQARQETT
ncbi:MAG: N-acetylmuramoyl-L-alanine amidase [Lachnospiraceae bacterium]|nr:N-acetylmuramoyl-L-alanine amidase [Lachnospiraceae bacterium]